MPKSLLVLILIVWACLPTNAAPAAERFYSQVRWYRAPLNDLHVAEVDTMAHKLGMRQRPYPTILAPKGKVLGYGTPSTGIFQPNPLNFAFLGAVPEPGDGFPITPSRDGSTYYAFQSGDESLNDFLRFAYLQEIDPRFTPPLGFRDYPVKNRNTFHGRMWLSQGYAWQYLLEEEPFFYRFPLPWMAGGYVVDGISAILIASIVHRLVQHPADPGHLGYAAQGLGMIAFTRLITVPFGNAQIAKHNQIAGSGYKIPR
jgi:hypothetical protein